MEMPSQMERLSKLSRTGTRLWIINALRFDNPGVKINPRYKMAELINLFEVPHPRK